LESFQDGESHLSAYPNPMGTEAPVLWTLSMHLFMVVHL
jgi:hypothetical protein